MVVEDTIDQPVNTLEVTATGHRFTDTSEKKEKIGIPNFNDNLGSSRKYHTHLTKQSANIQEHFSKTEKGNLLKQDHHRYSYNCYQAEVNNDVPLFSPQQEDQQNGEKVPTKSKCQIQPENNLISSVFFCSGMLSTE